ncbi:MAG: methyl-accepting chemotaxis protein [Spirochaetaceae bacterium]
MKLKLRGKVLLPTLGIMIFGLALLSVVSYILFTRTLHETHRKEARQLTELMAIQTDTWVKERARNAAAAAADPIVAKVLRPESGEAEVEEANSYLQKILETYDMFATIGVLDSNGISRANTKPDLVGELDLSSRGHFKQAIQGEPAISGVLISAVNDKPIFVVSTPIFVDGEPEGVLHASVELSDFTEYFADRVKLGESGYGYMVDENGMVIAHPNKEHIMEMDISEEDFGQTLITEKSGIVEYPWEGEHIIAAFTEVPTTGWIFATRAEYDELFQNVYYLRAANIITAVIALIVMTGLLLFIVRSITRRIGATVENLRDISEGEGDLTLRLEEKGSDEIDWLAHYVNITFEKLSTMIRSVKQVTDSLNNAGNELSANMTETASAVNEITANIDSIKERIINQSSGVDQAQATVGTIAKNIKSLDESIEEQSSGVSESSASIEQMVANIQSVTESLERNDASMKELQEASETGRRGLDDVLQMSKKITADSEGLEEAGDMIQKIASQTNLLAMNAAIEAAHAGESGKGFAVVADEIRKLAEDAGTQGSTITEALKELKESIDNIGKSLGGTKDRFDRLYNLSQTVAEQEGIIKNAMDEQVEGSTQVLEALSEIKEISRRVSESSQEMTSGSSEVIEEMQRLAQISSEISSNINEMASGAVQINQAVNQVAEMTQENNRSIEELADEVKRFKTE